MSDWDFLYKCTIIVVKMLFHLGIELYIFFFCYLNVLICGMLLLILDVRGRASALSLGPSFSLHRQALARVDVGYVCAHLIYIVWQCVTSKETKILVNDWGRKWWENNTPVVPGQESLWTSNLLLRMYRNPRWTHTSSGSRRSEVRTMLATARPIGTSSLSFKEKGDDNMM